MQETKLPRVTTATRKDLEKVAQTIEKNMYIYFDIYPERIMHVVNKSSGKELFNAYELAGKKKGQDEIAEELAVLFAQEFETARLSPMNFEVDELEEILAERKMEDEYKWLCQDRKLAGKTDHE